MDDATEPALPERERVERSGDPETPEAAKAGRGVSLPPSGQRRATGLAFLLSVNLSLSWNNWKSILLDDPVQHIDDFRSVHLAEVLAQVVRAGRQIICAAEDSALADLIARHLPVSAGREGKRVTLGVGPNGALSVLRDELVGAHASRVLTREMPSQSAI